jgi:hypothetical protein
MLASTSSSVWPDHGSCEQMVFGDRNPIGIANTALSSRSTVTSGATALGSVSCAETRSSSCCLIGTTLTPQTDPLPERRWAVASRQISGRPPILSERSAPPANSGRAFMLRHNVSTNQTVRLEFANSRDPRAGRGECFTHPIRIIFNRRGTAAGTAEGGRKKVSAVCKARNHRCSQTIAIAAAVTE